MYLLAGPTVGGGGGEERTIFKKLSPGGGSSGAEGRRVGKERTKKLSPGSGQGGGRRGEARPGSVSIKNNKQIQKHNPTVLTSEHKPHRNDPDCEPDVSSERIAKFSSFNSTAGPSWHAVATLLRSH